METTKFYPALIQGLPEADVPFKGVKAWISQAENHQIVYFEIEAIGEVAAHKHGAQWGYVFEGDMDLTIDGKTKNYQKGDSYFIPSGVMHSAKFNNKTWIMAFFADKSRYQPK